MLCAYNKALIKGIYTLGCQGVRLRPVKTQEAKQGSAGSTSLGMGLDRNADTDIPNRCMHPSLASM